jgi:hypothetical protein
MLLSSTTTTTSLLKSFLLISSLLLLNVNAQSKLEPPNGKLKLGAWLYTDDAPEGTK